MFNDWRGLDPKLIELWNDFSIPVRVIGEKIGVTKNACIGRAHRLGLVKRPTGGKIIPGPRKPRQPAKAKLVVKSESSVSKPVLAVKPTQRRDARGHFIAAPKRDEHGHFISTKPKPKPVLKPDVGKLTILDLNSHTCRWPSGNRPPFFYCGRMPEPGLPYCAEHSAVAFTGTRAKLVPIEDRISVRSKF